MSKKALNLKKIWCQILRRSLSHDSYDASAVVTCYLPAKKLWISIFLGIQFFQALKILSMHWPAVIVRDICKKFFEIRVVEILEPENLLNFAWLPIFLNKKPGVRISNKQMQNIREYYLKRKKGHWKRLITSSIYQNIYSILLVNLKRYYS